MGFAYTNIRDPEHLQSYLEYVHGLPCKTAQSGNSRWVALHNTVDLDWLKRLPLPFFDNQTGVVI